ncbi:uncharacterized protein [Anolis sagrei]|uniref:uncharacterized protein n=1 Tax=Anolis sagrei TaxID=38937 RepID=UPI003520C3ED
MAAGAQDGGRQELGAASWWRLRGAILWLGPPAAILGPLGPPPTLNFMIPRLGVTMAVSEYGTLDYDIGLPLISCLYFLFSSFTPRKNVGGPKGKGPAKRTPTKRPPPPSNGSSEDDEATIETLNALLARVNALEKERGAAAPSPSQRPVRLASRALLLKSLSSRITALEAARNTGGGAEQTQAADQAVSQPTTPAEAPAAAGSQPTSCQPQSISPSQDAGRLTHRKRVLICGHSYVHWAERQARRGHYGQHLGLGSTAFVDWRGRRGLRWDGLIPLLFDSSVMRCPDILVIHLGGNDLGLLKGRALFLQAVSDMRKILDRWPQTHLVWSEVIPRLNWPGGGDARKIDGARKRVNRAMRKVLGDGLGTYIQHPDIVHTRPELYRHDGVHLSDQGNALFLANLQLGIRQVLGDLVGDRG